MASQKVAIAGASGNVGPAIVEALVSAGFEVTVLSRGEPKKEKLPSNVRYETVDYSSKESLVKALKGHDAFVSSIPNHGDQPILVDASIEAGLKTFIPSEYGSDVFGNEKVAALPVFAGKKKAQDYLKTVKDKINWTVIVTGGFFDFGISAGPWANTKGGSTRVIDGGDTPRPYTTYADVGNAIVGVLKHPEETRHRAVYVQSVAVSQNKLVAIAKELHPDREYDTSNVTGDELYEGSQKDLKAGGDKIGKAMVGFILVSLYVDGYAPPANGPDNELLGIKVLTEEELTDFVAKHSA
jgi:uncharacterized protein YbjT (DUF2867 family)